ncbi:hypothetical protein AK830_g1641 [Neonectria ditissima]|uniref:Arrestin-like N-terminal domain-containing protein n=1 Tax=Neonectria ditissima TaxID=78410 RepID=A0A0P7BWK8_9HYPO|nr:hypothetical protein AK830_g1641 [Neonectria ditissima]
MNSLLNFASSWRNQELEIVLRHHYTSKVYGTGSIVSGDLVIKTSRDVPFDNIQIVFTGTSKVNNQDIAVASVTTHHFLNLEMPIPASAYPSPKVFTSGTTFTVPFKFIIPKHLTLAACSHLVESNTVRELHTRLPSTMGDWEKDDMSFQLVSIEYAIVAAVLKRPSSGGLPSKVLEASKPVRLLTSGPEDPPLSITALDKLYTLENNKSIRKRLSSQVLGQIKAVATQATVVRVDPVGRRLNKSSVQVSLTFEPSAIHVIPPVVSSVSMSIKANTWFSTRATEKLPNVGDGQRAYPCTVRLQTKFTHSEPWTQHVDLRSLDASENTRASPIFHTTTLYLPFDLPTSEKTFLPTFHTCLLSRTYSVQLSLSIGNATVELVVPLQITVDTPDEPHASGEESAADEELPDFDSVRTYWS